MAAPEPFWLDSKCPKCGSQEFTGDGTYAHCSGDATHGRALGTGSADAGAASAHPESETRFSHKSGSIATASSVVRRKGDEGSPEIVGFNREVSEPVDLGYSVPASGPYAMVRIEKGLSIPGPPRSYWNARVSVTVEVPCAPDHLAIQQGIEFATTVIEGQLSLELEDTQKALAELARR